MFGIGHMLNWCQIYYYHYDDIVMRVWCFAHSYNHDYVDTEVDKYMYGHMPETDKRKYS